MLKKKICGILAAMMVATTVLGGQGISVNASTLNNVDTVTRATASIPSTPEDTETPDKEDGYKNEDGTYKDGYYKLNNKVHHEKEIGKTMARNIISEVTNMEVKDGKIYVMY